MWASTKGNFQPVIHLSHLLNARWLYSILNDFTNPSLQIYSIFNILLLCFTPSQIRQILYACRVCTTACSCWRFLSVSVWFIQSSVNDPRSQTLPVISSLLAQNGVGGSSSEIHSQRSPDGSEDGDSSQSKCKNIKSSYKWYYLMIWWLVCSNVPCHWLHERSRSHEAVIIFGANRPRSTRRPLYLWS